MLRRSCSHNRTESGGGCVCLRLWACTLWSGPEGTRRVQRGVLQASSPGPETKGWASAMGKVEGKGALPLLPGPTACLAQRARSGSVPLLRDHEVTPSEEVAQVELPGRAHSAELVFHLQGRGTGRARERGCSSAPTREKPSNSAHPPLRGQITIVVSVCRLPTPWTRTASPDTLQRHQQPQPAPLLPSDTRQQADRSEHGGGGAGHRARRQQTAHRAPQP